ncbi:jacalin-like lectin [Streptomyces sp. NPDC059161]|uniref:jacalin-like lectin n=1 Tax=Streptomyces sp. NPDC059161 TaxID=3346749 RepID=UPI0036ACFD7C
MRTVNSAAAQAARGGPFTAENGLTDAWVERIRKGTPQAKGRFTTNLGRPPAGGSTTSDCVTHTAPDGWQIAGFHGRPGDEADKIGFIDIRR